MIMATKGLHVVPSGNKWSVIRAGAKRVSGYYQTQQEAMTVAQDRAKREGGELYIHGRDGRIRDRSSFGRDPFPPKG